MMVNKGAVLRARELLGKAVNMLCGNGYENIAEIIERLFDMSLLHFIEGSEKNPVHHMAYVTTFMSEIMLDEGADEREIKCGIVAALLHDIGGSRVEAEKAGSSDIASAPSGNRLAVVDKAIGFRQAHMYLGAEIAEDILHTYNAWFGEAFSCDEVREITRLIRNHDNPSMASYKLSRGTSGSQKDSSVKDWLIAKDDRLMMFLREADRLWMLSQDGIDFDLKKDRERARKRASEGIAVSETVDPKTRVIRNIKRHREEANLYARVFGGNTASEYGFRNGLLYRTDAGYNLYKRLVAVLKEKYMSEEVSVAVSLGGTKVKVGLVYGNGQVIPISGSVEWRTKFGLSHENPEDSDALVVGIASMISEAVGYVPVECIARIGLSTKGPLAYDKEGVLRLGYPKRTTTLPFENYPIAKRLDEILREFLQTELPKTEVLHDGAASILGEVKPGGTLAGYKDAVAVLIGTGAGLGVIENGELYQGDSQESLERVFGSLGRHLVHIPDDSPFGYRYEYRGIEQGETRAAINRSVGETYFSERVAGPWLAKRVAESLLIQRSAVTLENMGLADLGTQELQQFAKGVSTPNHKELEKRILIGLTQAALKSDQWAVGQIAEIGFEIGRALAEFISEFQNRNFVRNIVLGASVAERLGLGVPGNSSRDLVLERVREGIAQSLGSMKIEIRRSSNYDRELLAFMPGRWNEDIHKRGK